MKPISISEQMMFNTVRLQAGSSFGTGFFYDFKIDDKIYPTIITNKHVVNNKEIEVISFHLHLSDGDKGSDENYKVTIKTKWYFHSSKDLCFCFINPVFERVKMETGKDVFYIGNDESILGSREKLEKLSAREEVTMVGYPIGLWDEKNNFPIFRRGYTASHPAFDFNDSGIGVVDMACFPGSSGSPIYVLNEKSYKEKGGGLCIGSRIVLLGILFAGPQYNAQGNIVVQTIPTQQTVGTATPIMTNLGYYIKAEELQEFKARIQSIV